MSFPWASKACTSSCFSKNSFTFKFKELWSRVCSPYRHSDSDLSIWIFLALWSGFKGEIQQGQEGPWCFYTFLCLSTAFLFSTGQSTFSVMFRNALITVPKSESSSSFPPPRRPPPSVGSCVAVHVSPGILGFSELPFLDTLGRSEAMWSKPVWPPDTQKAEQCVYSFSQDSLGGL